MESWDPDAPMNKTAPDASMAAKGGKKERGISRIPPDTGCLISLLLHPRFDWVETQEQIIDPLSARCFSCPRIGPLSLLGLKRMSRNQLVAHELVPFLYWGGNA